MSRLKLGSTFTSLVPRLLLPCLGASVALTMASACLEHPLKPVELEKGSEIDRQLQLTVNKDVDILFMIDNSGSMGPVQANLGANFPAFIEVLEAEDVEANYRIGVTTSDNGQAEWCNNTTPEAGKLVMSSCKTRINDFLFSNNVDVRDLACNDICNLTEEELEILPSITDVDKTPKPRPWLENIEGKKNIPAGTDAAAAFACFGPQGVNGCGFEAQLESMYLALTRAQTNTEASYGFLRASAILAVVLVTDEVDCSYNKNWSEIFAKSGSRFYWSDPEIDFPTSTVCWRAGVECVEGPEPGSYTSCDAVNKDTMGNIGVPDPEAVLHPMSRYVGFLQGIEDQKKEINDTQELIVALIGGVTDSGIFYSDIGSVDPKYQSDFGIGPGCEAPPPPGQTEGIRAVPPVRMRDLTNAFTPDNMFSICDESYSDALLAIANIIKSQIQPACYSECVKDTDASTDIVEPECTVEEKAPGTDGTASLQECRRDANGYVTDPETGDYAMPGADINVCYAALTDSSDLSASTLDDMSPECKTLNYNLEFKIIRRPGFPAIGGTSISATCSLADFPDLSCPGIGG